MLRNADGIADMFATALLSLKGESASERVLLFWGGAPAAGRGGQQ